MKYVTLILAFCLGLFPLSANTQTIFLTDFEGRPGNARIEAFGNNTTRIQLDLFLEETIADIRGVFFDLETEFSEFAISGPSVTGWYSDSLNTDPSGLAADQNFGPLSRNVNLNGTGNDFGFKVELGTPGIGGDDIRFASIVLSNAWDMALGDTFGIRLMSVGETRSGSLKLVGENPSPAPVPEPTTVLLLGVGLLIAARMGRFLTPGTDSSKFLRPTRLGR